MERIYADNAGTTPMAAEVIETMTEMMKNVFGNASAVSSFGREARRVLDESRHVIAESINAKSDNEIVFTSGGPKATILPSCRLLFFGEMKVDTLLRLQSSTRRF